MRFDMDAGYATTNCSLEDMRLIRRFSFMREPLPDYITLKGHPDEDSQEDERNDKFDTRPAPNISKIVIRKPPILSEPGPKEKARQLLKV